jgi:hypothetical protein
LNSSNSVGYLIVENFIVFDFGRLERMEGGNRSSATNSNNSNYEVDRERVLSFMRDVEGGVGIIPGASIESSTGATTTQTEAARLRRYYSQSIFRWGELDGVRIIYIEDDEGEDYLRRFTLADNDILIRYIRYFRPRLNYSTAIEMIWNSRFTWQQIKQHVEDYTYEFNFECEFFLIGDPSEVVVDGSDTEEDESDRVEYEVISSDTEEEEDEVNRSARAAAVDALPEVVIGEEKENGDVAMCAVCGETFSSGESAKRLACTHLYHSKCILKWFDRNQSCPICRRQLVLIEGSLVVLDLNEQG